MGYNEEALKRIFAKAPEAGNNADEPPAVEPEKTLEPVTVPNSAQDPVNMPEPVPHSKQIIEISISELNDYPKQLFKPYTEEKLKKLETSIRENGIIVPLLVRLVDYKYQIVCGHNRRTAASQAGFQSVPCIAEEMTDDEADIKMVETNLLTRTGLLPSEKGAAYRLKLEAIKHQGVRLASTSTTNAVEANKASVDILGEQVGACGTVVNNYIRITYLIQPLIDLVDNNSLPMRPAVELSYMTTANQETAYNFFYLQHKLYIDEQLAKQLKEQSRIADLTKDSITALLPPSQGKTVKQTSKFSIPTKPLIKLLDKNALTKDIEKEILNVLIEYFQKKKNGDTELNLLGDNNLTH